jgi:hypothetical protein
VNSGEFLHRKRFYIGSSPQDADNKGSVSSYCVKTVLIAHCNLNLNLFYFRRSYIQDMENVMCIINSSTSITVNILQIRVINIDRKNKSFGY